MLQGKYVVKTIGNNIVRLASLDPTTAACIAVGATFAACVWVALATWRKMPVSTSHSIVGAVAGAGLALDLPVHWKVLRDIFLCWVLTPAGAIVLGYVFFRALRAVFPRVVPDSASGPVLTILVVSSGCYVAYTWGANDVANATGLLAGTGMFPVSTSIALGGLAIGLGIVTWGYKVIETIGSRITHMLPLMAFAAQLASAVNVHVYTVLGVPVSTSHSIVGAIFGVGLVRGVRVVDLGIMREILVCWFATPLVSGLISFVVLKTAGRFIMPT
jgi:PiT family inorganic phosphate transporter